MADNEGNPVELPTSHRIPPADDPQEGAPLLYANLIDSVVIDDTVMLDFSIAYPRTGVARSDAATSVPIEGVARVRVARVFLPKSRFERWLNNYITNQMRTLATPAVEGESGDAS